MDDLGLVRTLVAASGDMMIVSTEDGRISFVNEAMARFAGYASEELAGRSALVLYDDPQDRARFLAELAANGRVENLEMLGVDRRGKRRRVKVSIWPLPLANAGPPLLLTRVIDIHDEGRTARALRVLSACTAAVFRAVDSGALIADACRIIAEEGGFPLVWWGVPRRDTDRTVEIVAAAGPERAYLHEIQVVWSDTPEGRGPTGTAIREGRSVVRSDLHDPDFLPWREAASARGLRASIALPIGGTSETVGALNIYSADPDAFDVQERGLLELLAQGLGHGLSSLRRAELHHNAERALRESEAANRRLLEALPDAIFRMSADGVILAVHPSPTFDPFDAKGALIGRHYSTVMTPLVALKMDTVMRDGGVATGLGELRYTQEVNGVTRHFETRLIPQVGGDWVGVVRDTTERHSLQEQLLQSQKLETVGRLAAGVAHDFNNLLTVIAGNAELVLDSGPSDIRDEVEAILTAAGRGATLTQQLLAFGRRQPFRPTLIDLGAMLEGFKGSLQRLLGEEILLETEIEADLPKIAGDAAQLEQLVLNLAVNARDAMPKGGRLSMTVEAAQADAALARALGLVPGHYVRLTVADDGCGMDASTLAHAFEPFFTTKAPGSGTGLGLASVYGIAVTHGGAVTTRSEVGQGAEFEIWLPVTDRRLRAGATGRPGGGRVAGGSEHVLLVEDELAVRRLAERMLRDLGYRVSCADDGPRALALVEAGLRPDLLLTDVVMPGMSGPAVARTLVSRLPQLKVLYVSGYSGTALSERGGPDSETHLLRKPFDRVTLSLAVRRALDEGRPPSWN